MLNTYTIVSYLATVTLSFWIYKVINAIFFHPLKNVPGPLIYQFFPLIFMVDRITGGYHITSLKLHKKYGKAVRTGWNSVSFSSKEATKIIYSTYTFRKSIVYEGFHVSGETTLVTRDRDFHRKRKRIVGPSYSESSIASLEALFNEKGVQKLIEKIKGYSSPNQSIDLEVVFHCLTLDIIGELAFGRSFNMIDNGFHPVLGWIKDYLFYSALRGSLTFLRSYVDSGTKHLYEFAYESIDSAKTHKNRNTILESFLNAVDPETGVKLTSKEVAEESMLQIFAGTDTTANALIWTFYLLLKNPDKYNKLNDEILKVFPDKNSITYKDCKKKCQYLNAAINESMRIFPSVAGTLTRDTPKGGKIIEGHFIPEGTIVGTSTYAMHNLEEHFENPDFYLPERWLNAKDDFKENFIPFSIGPRACLGRTLAMMVLTLTTASLIRNFEFSLVDEKLVLNSSYHIVLKPYNGKLLVCSKIRE
ncbi:cytochrome P450 [Neoconidiobolus thromboides FSU 785]|nr:cytochrome P450 [Neoconidiobolus thromboides FSU 785]